MNHLPSHLRILLIFTYLVDLLLYALVVTVLYVPDWLYGDNLLPFTYNNVQFEALWYHIIAFLLLSVSVYMRVNTIERVVSQHHISFKSFAFLDALLLVFSIPLWCMADYRMFALMLTAIAVMKCLVDSVFYLKNEYTQVLIFMIVIFIFAATDIGFVQWGRCRMTYQQAELVVLQCSSSEHWALPSSDWSVAQYDEGELIRREGKYRFLPHIDVTKAHKEGSYRINYQETEHFVFARGESVYIVSRSAWPDYVTLIVNVTSIFFIYVAISIFVYWINFVLHRRMLIRRSFFARLRVSILFFLLGSLLVVFLLTMTFVWHRYTTNAKNTLKHMMTLLVDYASPAFNESDAPEAVFDIVSRMSDLYDTKVSVYDDKGYLVFTTDTVHVVHNIIVGADNPFQSMQSAVEAHVVFDYARKMKIQSYGILTPKTGPSYYAVMWSESDMARIRSEMSFFLVMLLVLYFVLVTLAVLFSYIVSRQLARPLRDIDRCMSAISLDSPNMKIDVVSDDSDELSHLINNYNQMVDKLEESATELALIERENSWRDMSRQIAHEIKNPLTPMRLILQQMMMNNMSDVEDLRAKIRSQAATLLVQVDTLYATACSLSDFARQPLQCPVPVCMSEKAQHVAELFRHNDSDVLVDVVVEPGAEKACVYIDKNLALRLFTNLVRNAIQAIPDTRQGVVKIVIASADGEVKVSVADNGAGMTPDVISRIFKANFTTKTKGMGLGLCVVKNAVDVSDGRIDVDSTVGEGSTFTITWREYKA